MAIRTRVKICGITRQQDALAAATHGVDAIGLVFYSKSSRYVDIEQARRVIEGLPAFVARVALFLNPEPSQVTAVTKALPIDLLQFHGSETAELCRSFDRPYIKALGMASRLDLVEQAEIYHDAGGLLLDSHSTGVAGGTGETFDWAEIPDDFRRKIILAGGLSVSNVAQAIQTVRPYAIDLSSGVETSPGTKDAALIEQLMNEVQRVDCEHCRM